MIEAAPRITAGYDADAPREFVFPAAAARRDLPQQVPDPAELAADLAAALTGICELPVRVAPIDGGSGRLQCWRADDGSSCGLGGGHVLAAAMLNRQCGGAFEAVTGAMGSAHVERCREALLLALRGLLVPLSSSWAEDNAAQHCPPSAFAVEAAGVHDRVDVVLAAAATMPPATAGSAEWRARLRTILDDFAIPVRLVLHDGTLAVRAARALAIGDVLPIATAHEVGLRVGTLAFARGHMIDTDTGTPRVRIVAQGRRTEGA